MGQPIVKYESGQTVQAFEAISDSGDQKVFESSFAPWSRASGFAPVIAPYGVKTGGAITPASSDDEVDVAAMTVVAPGMSGADSSTGVVSISAAAGIEISRGVTTDTHRITSITVNSSGTIVAVAGVDNTAFSETRGADGGPPLIPDGSIEVGQVRTTSVTSAAVLSSEIFQVPNTHQERSTFPVWSIDYVNGNVEFVEALPSIHTGTIPKQVWVRGATPLFAPAPKSSDWAPADATYSINSTDTYDGPQGGSSSSLSQASFNMILEDGVSDNILSLKGENLWFEFRPDRDLSLPKQLTQGIFGVSRTFPAGGGRSTASCTVTPEQATSDVTS